MFKHRIFCTQNMQTFSNESYFYQVHEREIKYHKLYCTIWNILFMAPRIKMIVIKTYFGAVVVKRCDVSTCYDRSWSLMSLTGSSQRHA